MRNRALFLFLIVVTVLAALAQDWKHVHKSDDAKWGKATGLDPSIVHKLWREASSSPDEKDDDSRIASLDLEGLAERHDVLLVTYAGEKNCLTLTVFRQLTETKFNKVWSVQQPPDGTGFCDNEFGTAEAGALNGVINVRIPHAGTDGSNYLVYAYAWNGITYRYAGKTEMQGR
jgi:hypothetical protein